MGDVFSHRYELVDPLGEGGGGLVWRVWDHGSKQYLAAKVLRQVDAGSLMRFMREQSMRIEHTHVLTPVSWAGEDDRVLFTMPLVRGGSVATLVGDFGGLPAPWAATLLDQTLIALEQIHSHGLLHRDVKPANLLLDATGRDLPRLRLSDFGVAAVLDQPRLTHGALALGTKGYLAPECLTGDWNPDPRADLFSTGMTALEMVTGAHAAEPAEGTSTTSAPEVGARLRAHNIDPDLVAWICRLTEADPADRPQSAAAARDLLGGTGLVAAHANDLGSEVEVFDHVPALPPGWTIQGPEVPPNAPGTSPPLSARRTDGDESAQRRSRTLFVALIGIGVMLLVVAPPRRNLPPRAGSTG